MGDSGSDDDDFQDEPHKRKGTKRRKQGATGGPRTAQPASFKDTGARTATGDNITPPTEYEEELFWCVHSPRVHTAPARAHSLLIPCSCRPLLDVLAKTDGLSETQRSHAVQSPASAAPLTELRHPSVQDALAQYCVIDPTFDAIMKFFRKQCQIEGPGNRVT